MCRPGSVGSVLKTMGKKTVCHSVFVFSNGKRNNKVQACLFWFENEKVEVVLSNCFRKRNQTKRKFPFILKTKRNDDKNIKTCPTLSVRYMQTLLRVGISEYTCGYI